MKQKMRKGMELLPSFVESAAENAKEITEINNDTEMTIYKTQLAKVIETSIYFIETKEYKKRRPIIGLLSISASFPRNKKLAPLIIYAFAIGWREGRKNGNGNREEGDPKSNMAKWMKNFIDEKWDLILWAKTAVEDAKDIAEIKEKSMEFVIFKLRFTELMDSCIRMTKTEEYRKGKKRMAPLIAFAFATGWKEGRGNGNNGEED